MKKKLIRKTMISQFLLSISVYTLGYFICCFIIWDFKNPFQWIIDLPTYEDGSRFGILCFLIIYYGISIHVIYEHHKNKSIPVADFEDI